jgi:hypothetical protein
MKEIKELTTLVEDVVDRGTAAVAEVHKSIARLPFDAVEQIPALAPPARKAREIHDSVIDLIYGSIRKVNHAVCEAVTTVAGEPPGEVAHRPAQRRSSKHPD